MTESEHHVETESVFGKALNQHGHPFQYAVIRRAHQLKGERRSSWVFEASEFPVEVQNYHARIDFVLSQWSETFRATFRYLVAECKRTNPALQDWFFTKAPYVRRDGVPTDILVESLRKEGDALSTFVGRLNGSESIYHVAVEVKKGAKGDTTGGGRGAIEEAATQVIRGTNGLINCLSRNQRYVAENCPVSFIPAIFTTAGIWATDIKPWLWFQYHVSPGLQHGVERQAPKEEDFSRPTLGDLIELEYARTIAIVGSGGIDAFLASQHWW